MRDDGLYCTFETRSLAPDDTCDGKCKSTCRKNRISQQASLHLTLINTSGNTTSQFLQAPAYVTFLCRSHAIHNGKWEKGNWIIEWELILLISSHKWRENPELRMGAVQPRTQNTALPVPTDQPTCIHMARDSESNSTLVLTPTHNTSLPLHINKLIQRFTFYYKYAILL